jgi:hypothetical protein
MWDTAVREIRRLDGIVGPSLADMYAGTANWSHVAGATATFRFTGTQIAPTRLRSRAGAVGRRAYVIAVPCAF